jgi:hypothetical protein
MLLGSSRRRAAAILGRAPAAHLRPGRPQPEGPLPAGHCKAGEAPAHAAAPGYAEGPAPQWQWHHWHDAASARVGFGASVEVCAILKVGRASSDRSSMGFASCACPLPCPNRSTQEGRVPMLESALESKATDQGGTG